MLVELSMVEQRYQAVREVLDSGATITEVATHYGCRGSRRSMAASYRSRFLMMFSARQMTNSGGRLRGKSPNSTVRGRLLQSVVEFESIAVSK
jgi:transposase-like protein